MRPVPEKTATGRFTRRLLMLKLIVFAAIVALTVYYIEFDELLRHFTWDLALAVVFVQPLVFCSFVPMASRFRMLTARSGLRYWVVYKAMLIGIGLNLIIPGRAAELLKVIYLRKNTGLPFASGAASLFMERLGDLILAGTTAILSLNMLMFGLDITVIVITLAVLTFGIVLVPVLEAPLLSLFSRIPWLGLAEMLKDMLRHVVNNTKNGVFYKSLFVGSFAWMFSYLSVLLFLFLSGGSVTASPYQALALLVATTFGGAIPALPGGLGTYEAAGVLVLSGFGYGFEEALAISLALHASQFTFIFLAGLGIAVIEGSGVSGLLREINDYRRGGKTVGVGD